MDNIEFIQSLSVLQVKEGDTVVLKVQRTLSSTETEGITKQLKGWLDGRGLRDVKVLILEPGMDIGIIRKAG